jgi:hypothetical protein
MFLFDIVYSLFSSDSFYNNSSRKREGGAAVVPAKKFI